MKKYERECITLVKSKLFNPHRNKRVYERTPIPLINIDSLEVIKHIDSLSYEIMLHRERISPIYFDDWVKHCRKLTKKWFSHKMPEFQLGFQWTGDGSSRFKNSYWLEYSILENEVY